MLHEAQPLPDGQTYGVRAAVLYDESCDMAPVEDMVDWLDQSSLLGLTTEAVALTETTDLSAYDLVIPAPALAEVPDCASLEALLEAYTMNGGIVLLDNGFAARFSNDYLGISEVRPIEGCPTELQFPAVGEDLQPLQTLVEDYAGLYPDFYDYDVLSQQDYGVGFVADEAQALVTLGELALYTYREYGEGAVLLTNPLLPNFYSLGNLSMTRRTGEETAFSATTSSMNRLFYGGVASLAAKEKFGYALQRV